MNPVLHIQDYIPVFVSSKQTTHCIDLSTNAVSHTTERWLILYETMGLFTEPKGYTSLLQTKANLRLLSYMHSASKDFAFEMCVEKFKRDARASGDTCMASVNVAEQNPVGQLLVPANEGAVLGLPFL